MDVLRDSLEEDFDVAGVKNADFWGYVAETDLFRSGVAAGVRLLVGALS